jgi:hypothetical protein
LHTQLIIIYCTPAHRAISINCSPPITLFTNLIAKVVKYAAPGTFLAIVSSTTLSRPNTIWYLVLDDSAMNIPHTRAVSNIGGIAT